jgi:hypothetical protein
MLVICNVKNIDIILLHEQVISKHFLVDYGQSPSQFHWNLISQIHIGRDMSVIIGM